MCDMMVQLFARKKKQSEREDKQNVFAKSIIIEIRKTPFDAHQKKYTYNLL